MLETCLALRHRVFVLEQGVAEDLELDGLDGACAHFLALDGARPVGAARLRVTGEGRAKAERVAVRAEARGQGVGRALMDAIEAEARRRGHQEVVLNAQDSAIPFYLRLCYVAEGEPFIEAGIVHVKMRRVVA